MDQGWRWQLGGYEDCTCELCDIEREALPNSSHALEGMGRSDPWAGPRIPKHNYYTLKSKPYSLTS